MLRVRLPWGTVRVAGASMEPAYPGGSWLVVRWSGRRGVALRRGDVVIARRPDRPDLLIVKRIIKGPAGGAVWLQGDNEAYSDDSRLFGWVAQELVVGRVLLRYR